MDLIFDTLEEYDPLKLVGDCTRRERKEIVDQFQSGENRLLIANIAVGGTGLNLQDTHGDRPRCVLIVPNYHATDMFQAVYRCYRKGAKSDVVVRLMFGEDARNELNLLKNLGEKNGVWKTIMDDGRQMLLDCKHVYETEDGGEEVDRVCRDTNCYARVVEDSGGGGHEACWLDRTSEEQDECNANPYWTPERIAECIEREKSKRALTPMEVLEKRLEQEEEERQSAVNPNPPAPGPPFDREAWIISQNERGVLIDLIVPAKYGAQWESTSTRLCVKYGGKVVLDDDRIHGCVWRKRRVREEEEVNGAKRQRLEEHLEEVGSVGSVCVAGSAV